MVEQLSVFLENRAGRLAELAHALGDAGHDMKVLSVADTSEFGVARLLCDRPSAACDVLQAKGFGVTLTPVVAVEVPNRPGGLASVLELMGGAGINIGYAYCFVTPGAEYAVDIFRVEDVEKATDVLERAGLRVLSAGELYEADGV